MVINIKITELFNLNLTQAEIDFINIDTEKDTKVFLEPFSLKNSKCLKNGKYSYAKVESFFDYIYTLYVYGEQRNAFNLLQYSNEAHELHIGYSKGAKGRGVSDESLDRVFSAISKRPEIAKDMLTDPSTFVLLVPDFAEDRMSDLVVSVIKKELVEYTLEQAVLYGMEIDYEEYDYGYYWNVCLRKVQIILLLKDILKNLSRRFKIRQIQIPY